MIHPEPLTGTSLWNTVVVFGCTSTLTMSHECQGSCRATRPSRRSPRAHSTCALRSALRKFRISGGTFAFGSGTRRSCCCGFEISGFNGGDVSSSFATSTRAGGIHDPNRRSATCRLSCKMLFRECISPAMVEADDAHF